MIHTTVPAILADIAAFEGAPEDFVLEVDESLLDPQGFIVALFTDRILPRGWLPDGTRARDGHRVFRYRRA